MLVGLLLLLLSGIPQLGISLSEMDTEGKKFRRVTLSRSLLMDKLLPEVAALTPPEDSRAPNLTVSPPDRSFITSFWRQLSVLGHEPGPWLRDLTLRLYQHHSSYV